EEKEHGETANPRASTSVDGDFFRLCCRDPFHGNSPEADHRLPTALIVGSCLMLALGGGSSSFSYNPRMSDHPIHVIGGGLAGSECAWQLAERGMEVVLHEMRPVKGTPAHKSGDLAELVCSNSLRSDDPFHAAGLLKREMETFGSLIIGKAR